MPSGSRSAPSPSQDVQTASRRDLSPRASLTGRDEPASTISRMMPSASACLASCRSSACRDDQGRSTVVAWLAPSTTTRSNPELDTCVGAVARIAAASIVASTTLPFRRCDCQPGNPAGAACNGVENRSLQPEARAVPPRARSRSWLFVASGVDVVECFFAGDEDEAGDGGEDELGAEFLALCERVEDEAA